MKFNINECLEENDQIDKIGLDEKVFFAVDQQNNIIFVNLKDKLLIF